MPVEKASIGDDISAKVLQDARVQERELSVPEVISEGEKPSSSIVDISVDHKEIMKQPSTDDSAALRGVAQDFTKIEERPGPEPTVTTVDHSPPDSSNLPSSEIPVSIVSTDVTSISDGLENNISSQKPGVLEKELDSTPRDVIGIDSQPESRLIEDETQILEKPKGIDIPIGSPQAGVIETDTQPGDDAIEGSKEESVTDHDLETGDEPLPSSDKSDKDEIVSLDRDVSGNVEIVIPFRSRTEIDVNKPNKLFGDSIAKSDVDVEPLFDNDVTDVSPTAGVDSNASVLPKDKVIASDQHEGLVDISQNESQSRKIRVQDAGESEKTNASIPDEELSSEEPIVTDVESADILRHDVRVPLPVEKVSIGDDTNAKVSQDAGVQERELSVSGVISVDENPSSSILDISVDHQRNYETTINR